MNNNWEKAIFPFDFEIVNDKYRTPRINEVLRLILSVDGYSQEIKKGELFKNLELSLQWSRRETSRTS